MKKWRIILSIVCILSFVLGGLVFAYGYTQTEEPQRYEQDYTFHISEIEKISIDGSDAQINFIPVQGDEIRVSISGKVMKNQKPIIAEQKGSQLIVSQRFILLNLNFRLFDAGNVINVYIDPAYGKDVSISTVSKPVNINDLKTGKLSVSNVSGDILMQSVECDVAIISAVSGSVSAKGLTSAESTVSTVSGDVTLQAFAGDFNGSSVSGKVEVSYTNFDNNIKVDTVSGAIVLKLTNATDFMLSTDTVSGRLTNEFIDPLMSGGKNKIIIDTVSGSMVIKK